jgi:hypothetical protein
MEEYVVFQEGAGVVPAARRHPFSTQLVTLTFGVKLHFSVKNPLQTKKKLFNSE